MDLRIMFFVIGVTLFFFSLYNIENSGHLTSSISSHKESCWAQESQAGEQTGGYFSITKTTQVSRAATGRARLEHRLTACAQHLSD